MKEQMEKYYKMRLEDLYNLTDMNLSDQGLMSVIERIIAEKHTLIHKKHICK